MMLVNTLPEPTHTAEIRQQIRRFVLDKAPREKRVQWDREHTWPRELFSELAALGICGLTIEERYGGLGRDIWTAVAVVEELSRIGVFLWAPFVHSAFYGGLNISEYGSTEQKEELLPKLARGEMFFAYGLSEPDVGGDLASVKTRAVRDGDHLVINGAKRWCTGANWSDYIYCLVRSDAEVSKRRGLSFVLVPTSAPGITMQEIEHVAVRYTQSCDVFFDNVRLPMEMVVGGREYWNRGWEILTGSALDVERLEVAAGAFGIAQAALDEAWAYAKERVQFGKPIAAHQVIAHKLVTARTMLEASRLVLYNAARVADTSESCAAETAMAKLFVCDRGLEIATVCQQIMGAYGLTRDYDIERHVRDLQAMVITGGSSDMQRNNLAKIWDLPKG